jgi:serine/threonine protein kinase
MGKVYRARDRACGQTVALKLVRVQTEIETARFEREAKALSALSHPGIVGYLAHDIAALGELYSPWNGSPARTSPSGSSAAA